MRQPRPEEVIDAVKRVTGFDPLTASSSRSVVHARRLAVHALRELTEMSYPEIARALGYADHTTVVYHMKILYDYDQLREVVQEISDARVVVQQ